MVLRDYPSDPPHPSAVRIRFIAAELYGENVDLRDVQSADFFRRLSAEQRGETAVRQLIGYFQEKTGKSLHSILAKFERVLKRKERMKKGNGKEGE